MVKNPVFFFICCLFAAEVFGACDLIGELRIPSHLHGYIAGITVEPFSYQQYLPEGLIGKPLNVQSLEALAFYVRKSGKFAHALLDIRYEGNAAHCTLAVQPHTFISRIQFHGITFGKHTLLSVLGIQVGDVLQGNAVKEAALRLREHFQDQGYLDVRVQERITYLNKRRNASVSFSIAKGHRYEFGSISLKAEPGQNLDSALLASVQQDYKNKILTRERREALVHSLKECLYQQGILFAQVTSSLSKDTHSYRADIVFNIELQTAHRVKLIGFGSFESEALRVLARIQPWALSPTFCEHALTRFLQQQGLPQASVAVSEDDRGWQFTASDVVLPAQYMLAVEGFDPRVTRLESKEQRLTLKQIEQVERDIAEALKRKGFLQPHLERSYQGGDGSFRCVLSISAGEQSLVTSLQVPAGMQGFDDLIQQVQVSSQVLSQDFIDLLHERFQAVESRSGVRLQVERRQSQRGYDLIISERLPFNAPRSSDLIIHADNNCDEHLVARIKDQVKRSRLDDLQELQRRLLSTGAFRSVVCQPYAGLDPYGQQPVYLSLISDDPYEIRLRLGVAGVSHTFNDQAAATYKLGLGFVAKNVSARADKVVIDIDNTRYYTTVNAAYTRPILGYSWTDFFIRAHNHQYRQPVFWSSEAAVFKVLRTGGYTGIDFITNGFKTQLFGGIERVKIYDFLVERAVAVHVDPALINQDNWFLLSELGTTLAPAAPASALVALGELRAKVRGMFCVAGLANSFGRLDLEQALYINFNPHTQLALRGAVGGAFVHSFTNFLPSERFYLGGPSSIRSYAPDTAPPVACLPSETIPCLPVGGTMFALANAELRFRLINSLQLCIFEDVGVLHAPGFKNKALMATGLGLRYATPLGAIRLDVGFKPKREYRNDRRIVWFFTMGQTF